ncbi:MAG: hypothetical protein A2268_10420 [Candidatus Raymondbacteria bacterium RifOxyA12_full_50_37]|uniref:4Fe-4S ferredoxin-type domain-containing protein n=1 Tax=Candidatus Raymondbacteria bacterium RIFOXYD12_FULL_49_13 TaxID=1817890 RepID=A0A1F7FKK7_UNCRA|nr:MAG: hypothetical protein A2268_10420 [Candidatus Raymondbacteria bacterium RifOxyA12_full_50_37]OGJ90190.1 MAG: hypothetical protein A2248_16900 [Candidatus Raymondbacteria bacterium RIFOXYA2_FULL_49_16]OGJ97262.1 MAG: hypothetical protein A2453_01390 [Candidatus Raymondbacteria bacterium RIFOXYC2_FULL_50_21]OGJ98845.1 MAG: hypothetical protein A2350_21590 [Candidatus Raymondbacteria bacterium RifOxyB12_full_50_8]OGK07158.1 MAG: hypothetical protein A2519_09200 [Candidatus Raymondbacteria b
MAKGRIEIDRDACKGCGICVSACKHGVISLSEKNSTNRFGYRYLIVIDEARCTGCTLCGVMCPDSAIMVYKEETATC